MSNLPPSTAPDKTPIHWPSFAQLIFSSLAAFIIFGAAAVIAITAAFQSFSGRPNAPDPTQSFMVAGSLVFAAILVLPSAWYAWKRIAYPEAEQKIPSQRREFPFVLTVVVAALEAGTLLLGNWASQNSRLSWFLLPPLNVIASGLPVLWVVYMGTRGLIPGEPRRKWGVFAGGLVLGPLITTVLELILLAIFSVLGLLWIMLNPSLANQLNGVVYRLQSTAPNLDAVTNALLPILVNPGIVFLVFAFLSVIVPLLEEAIKPIGVWFLAGEKLRPAQGFAYGVLCGAGFGLFENLGNTSSAAVDWAPLAATRISTLLLHSFTSGLMGWALVSAWSERKYLRLAVTYAIAVIVHGLWNGLAILVFASQLHNFSDTPLSAGSQQLGVLSTGGIGVVGLIVLILFIGANTILRRSTSEATLPAAGEIKSSRNPANDTHRMGESAPDQSPPDLLPENPELSGDNPHPEEGETPHLPKDSSSGTNGTNMGNNE